MQFYVRPNQTSTEIDNGLIVLCLPYSGEPYDKAGGYGIQGMAANFLRRLEGSYSSVMGLPVKETTELLALEGQLPG